MDNLEWLKNELEETESGYEHAVANELASGYEPDATMERKYWAGYLDALNNVYNYFYGPGN